MIVDNAGQEFKVLVDLMNQKLGCPSFFNTDLLKDIDKGEEDHEAIVQRLHDKKLQLIRNFLQTGPFYTEGLENIVHQRQLEHHNNLHTQLNPKSLKNNLQKFIWKAEAEVSDTLLIDILLDFEVSKLTEICSNANYAVKYDEKGWTNNASAFFHQFTGV